MVGLSQYDVLVFVVVMCHLFVFGRSEEQSIYNKRQEIKYMIINMLKNWSHMYSIFEEDIWIKNIHNNSFKA